MKCNTIRDVFFAACNCDSRCHYYNDCCPDVTQDIHQHNGVQDGQIVSHRHSTVQDDIGIPQECFSCAKHDAFKTHQGIYIVDDCRDRNTCFDKNGSYDIENILYVTDDKNITYRNSKCARCNGISKYSYWRASFPMEDLLVCVGMNDTGINFKETVDLNTPSAPIRLIEHGCRMETHPPEGKSVRFCIQSIQHVKNCSTKFSPVKYGDAVFLNEECCRRETDDCTKKTTECVRWTTKDYLSPWDDKDGRGQIRLLPSSVLFQFTGVCMHKYL